MAIRLGPHDLHRAHQREAEAQCLDGLSDDAAGLTVETAAAELEATGFGLKAVDAWAEAALLAARSGRASDAFEHAMALVEEMGLHPLSGPLPR